MHGQPNNKIVILQYSSVAAGCRGGIMGAVDVESVAASKVIQSLYKPGQTHSGPGG